MEPTCPIPADSPAPASSREDFTATQWTQVQLAGQQDGSAAARLALERLCARYWPALYAYVRRKGFAPQDAEDLTQGFFSHLLEDRSLSRADKSRGRFRSFLLGAMQRYLVDEYRRGSAEKRGAGKVLAVSDFAETEKIYLEEADPSLTPEQVYDRRWASMVLDSAFQHLKAEFEDESNGMRFEAFKKFLSQEPAEGEYDDLARRLNIAPKAVSSAVCRFRERYRNLVRQFVESTVGTREDIDVEFAELFR